MNISNEKETKRLKEQSRIAFIQAGLIVSYFNGKNADLTVSEVFPYWTEEEQQEMKKQAQIEKYKSIMYKYVNHS